MVEEYYETSIEEGKLHGILVELLYKYKNIRCYISEEYKTLGDF